MPKIISTREQLLIYIASHAPYRFILRAIDEGEAENLGAFNIKGGEGWIVRTRTLINNKNYFISVTIVDRGYKIIITNVCPGWKYWVGDISEHELYRGDNPDKYAELREKEIADASRQTDNDHLG